MLLHRIAGQRLRFGFMLKHIPFGKEVPMQPRITRTPVTVVALCAAGVLSIPLGAQVPSASKEYASFDESELAERTLRRRAVEA